jgi:hypothetical protein
MLDAVLRVVGHIYHLFNFLVAFPGGNFDFRQSLLSGTGNGLVDWMPEPGILGALRFENTGVLCCARYIAVAGPVERSARDRSK